MSTAVPPLSATLAAAYPVHAGGSPRRAAQSLALARQVVPRDPHHIVLAFLWIAFVVLTVVAFFAILSRAATRAASSTSTSG